VLASNNVSDTETGASRSLLVLADGVQAAFAAGAVAELARRGARWKVGAGAGLGAQVALLALLGEAAEAERRWAREAALGCPMLESLLGATRRTLGEARGLTVVSDSWSLDGWLDPSGLVEHLAPEMAAVASRLSSVGARCAVAVEDVASGAAEWVELGGVVDAEAGGLLRAAAAFPAGWGPQTVCWSGAARRLWGGVGPALRSSAPSAGGSGGWDLVCGFPVPATARPALGGSLLELIQRRAEVSAAAGVGRWVGSPDSRVLRVVAPTEAAWRAWSRRDGADLGVEYPLPWERNGELAGAVVRFGAFAAEVVATAPRR
jgi:hypothetical protein